MKISLNDKLHKGFVFGLLIVTFATFVGSSMAYTQTNLVSNISGLAKVTDANVVNSWGIAHLPTGPWWVADNGMGVSTVYNGNGTPFPVGSPLVVTIPGLDNNSASPTGIVANSESKFNVTAGKPARFIFVTEDGTISAWNPNVDPAKAILMVNNSPDAVYKGVTIDSDTNGTFLYAANFRQGKIDVFDTDFKSVTMDPSAFVDSQLPAGYAPFNIQMVDGNLVVAFAEPDSAKHDEVDGPGLGYVDIFDPDGKLMMRLEHGNWLNAPWGVTMAPANFGIFSNDLLIGNFGSGQISAFDSKNGTFKGFLENESNEPIVIDGLWGLGFGNNANAGSSDTLFFAAGINKEQDGLFGNIVVSTPAARRPTEIIDNMTGTPVVNESTVKILAEDFMNFTPGDPYNITITRIADDVVEFNKSGTLLGLPKQTIAINWIPKTKGDYILRSEANTMVETRTVQVINQKVISPVPELSTLVLLSAGLLGLFGLSKRQRKD